MQKLQSLRLEALQHALRIDYISVVNTVRNRVSFRIGILLRVGTGAMLHRQNFVMWCGT